MLNNIELQGFRLAFLGEPGDFRLSTGGLTNHEAAKIILPNASLCGARRVIAPLPNGGSNLLDLSVAANWEETSPLKGESFIFRTIEHFDGVVLQAGDKNVAMYATADCPVGILWDTQGLKWALLHLGTKNLLAEPNIIASAIETLGVPAKQLQLAFGFGIGPCCYGFYPNDPILAQLRERFDWAINDDYPDVEKGPRAGQIAISLEAIIFEITCLELKLGGVTVLSDRCTSCDGRFHSRTRDEQPGFPESGRNCFLAYRK